MKSKTLRINKNKTKKKIKIHIGGAEFQDRKLIGNINERMLFLPEQKNEVSGNDISRVTQRLYIQQKPIVKPVLIL